MQNFKLSESSSCLCKTCCHDIPTFPIRYVLNYCLDVWGVSWNVTVIFFLVTAKALLDGFFLVAQKHPSSLCDVLIPWQAKDRPQLRWEVGSRALSSMGPGVAAPVASSKGWPSLPRSVRSYFRRELGTKFCCFAWQQLCPCIWQCGNFRVY